MEIKGTADEINDLIVAPAVAAAKLEAQILLMRAVADARQQFGIDLPLLSSSGDSPLVGLLPPMPALPLPRPVPLCLPPADPYPPQYIYPDYPQAPYPEQLYPPATTFDAPFVQTQICDQTAPITAVDDHDKPPPLWLILTAMAIGVFVAFAARDQSILDRLAIPSLGGSAHELPAPGTEILPPGDIAIPPPPPPTGELPPADPMTPTEVPQ